MKNVALTVLVAMSALSFATEAAESKFEWKGTVPAVTTYVSKTISFDSKFDINDYNSLTFIEQKSTSNGKCKLITMSEF
ncbi:hypothetical protein [Vibrio sp. L85]|uniref:hypothetical protein n=1 Tax=Vibrio sp. L85 TaxID=1769292 RepID=UPI0009A3A3AE|nr:hypothetical protein [Vibrio sp. L85]